MLWVSRFAYDEMRAMLEARISALVEENRKYQDRFMEIWCGKPLHSSPAPEPVSSEPVTMSRGNPRKTLRAMQEKVNREYNDDKGFTPEAEAEIERVIAEGRAQA